MTTKTLTREQETAYHLWWMSDQVPGSSMGGDDPNVINNAEELGRAAFLEGWGCGEGATLDGAVTPLMEALKAAQKVIHENDCQLESDCWDACLDARAAIKAAEEATG